MYRNSGRAPLTARNEQRDYRKFPHLLFLFLHCIVISSHFYKVTEVIKDTF